MEEILNSSIHTSIRLYYCSSLFLVAFLYSMNSNQATTKALLATPIITPQNTAS